MNSLEHYNQGILAIDWIMSRIVCLTDRLNLVKDKLITKEMLVHSKLLYKTEENYTVAITKLEDALESRLQTIHILVYNALVQVVDMCITLELFSSKR